MTNNFFHQLHTPVLGFLLIVFSNPGAQEYWLPISTGTAQTLQTLHFPDSLHGWAAGDSGVIVHTTDGGRYWTSQEVSPKPIQLVWIFDSLTALGVGEDYEFGAAPFVSG